MKTKYDVVKKNLENVLKIKKKYKSSLIINISCHRLAGASLGDWYFFAQEWKNKGANIMLGPLWNRAGYYGEKFNEMSVGLMDKNPSPCEKPFKQIAIEHDGRVVLCSLDYEHQIKIGNILEESIEDIWNGPVLRNYQESQLKQEKLRKLKLCKDCIRGGRYLLDENNLTKIMNYEIPKETSKKEFLENLSALDKF